MPLVVYCKGILFLFPLPHPLCMFAYPSVSPTLKVRQLSTYLAFRTGHKCPIHDKPERTKPTQLFPRTIKTIVLTKLVHHTSFLLPRLHEEGSVDLLVARVTRARVQSLGFLGRQPFAQKGRFAANGALGSPLYKNACNKIVSVSLSVGSFF